MPDDSDFDVVLLHSPTEDGAGARVVRARPGRLEAGEVRPVREGQPVLSGEIVKLAPRQDAPNVCDVTVVHAMEPAVEEASDARSHAGPAQVATSAYRASWERVFGGRSAVN